MIKIKVETHSESGIGTLKEKSTHAFIKNYLEPDKTKHEIRINGFIADIVQDNLITEIQTKDFGRLRQKIENYPKYMKIRIVYPVDIIKFMNWVDPETHEVLERRKVYSGHNIYDIFKELYKIRNYLGENRIEFKVITLETEEYKYLDGYGPNCKNRATKIDKIPARVIDEINFGVSGGYEKFIPNTLQNQFTSKEFAKQAKCKIDIARVTLLILTELGYVKRIGKRGREYEYKVTDRQVII